MSRQVVASGIATQEAAVMKTTKVLGVFLCVTAASIAGCASDSGDDSSAGGQDLSGGGDPGNTDQYAQMVGGGSDDEVKATGELTLPIPGLTAAPSGNAKDMSGGGPPQAKQSNASKDWVIDLSKVTLFEDSKIKITFDPTSKVVFNAPQVSMDQNIGPAKHFEKRLNHFDAVVAGGAHIRAVVQVATKGSADIQWWTGTASDTGENSSVPDPEMTIPLYDQPLTFPVLGVPVVIHPQLAVKVGCHLEAALNGTASAGMEYDMTFKKGIEFNLFRRYSKDPKVNTWNAGPDTWGPDHDGELSGDRILNAGWFNAFPDETDAPEPKMVFDDHMKAAVLANCYAEPQLNVSLYEFIGGTLKVHPYAIGVLKANPDSDPQIDYAVTYGLKAGVSAWAKLPILGKMSSPEYQLVDIGGDDAHTVKGGFNLGASN
jgi:hypothetical protein